MTAMTSTDESTTGLRPATRAVVAGREGREPGQQVGSPLVLTSTYAADGPVNYARNGNPTWSAFEEALGSPRGGRALVFGSGMAAVAAALVGAHRWRRRGPALGLQRHPGDAQEREKRGELTVRTVELTDTAATVDALAGADLVWLESPTNPLLGSPISGPRRGRSRGWCAVRRRQHLRHPLAQRPLELGSDLVVHSVTKYLSGHSDVILGACVVREDGDQIFTALSGHRSLYGAIAGPLETWLALRGIRTPAPAPGRASANAAVLATRLADHPSVVTVRYPGVGAMVAFDVGATVEDAEAVCAAVQVISHSTSLGGVETQIERRRRWPNEPDVVPDNLLRLSVGIEDVEDLWTDLQRALDSLG